MIGFPEIMIILTVISVVAFSVAMLASVLLRANFTVEQKLVWLLVMIVLPGIGAAIYYITKYEGKFSIRLHTFNGK